MNQKQMMMGIFGVFFLGILMTLFLPFASHEEDGELETGSMVAKVIGESANTLTLQDSNHGIYTISKGNSQADLGDYVSILYSGLLDRNIQEQEKLVIQSIEEIDEKSSEIPGNWQDLGIFSRFYDQAYKKMKTMSLDDKIGQILLVRYPDNAIEVTQKYQFGGYVFFAKDFASKTEEEVKKMIRDVQKVSNIPLLTAVDEEGGKVVRVSSNPNLVDSPFLSSQELYKKGGLSLIKEDTQTKSRVLKNLGLNVNLAPVVDVSTDSNAYIYARTLGQNTKVTSDYAKTVINASHGTSVSYTLKHFPGYGNNADTHQGTATDTRTLETLRENDFPPFEAGIKSSAEAVLISHNTLTNIDSKNPASLSATIHNLLRNELSFSGIVITDDLAMGATSNISNATVKAILAGNDMIITTDYENSVKEIKNAINSGVLDEAMIDKLSFRILAWKYYKGLLFDNEK